MPTTIKLKNSVTTTSAPSSLVQGEVAINITDKKVWVGNAATTPIQLLGDGGSGSFTSIAFGAGTVSSPSITFTGDTNTGIYSPAADTIAFTEGGVESMRIDSSGNVGIGTSSPATKLVVKGTHQSGQGIINIIADSGTRYSTLSFTNNTTQKGIVFHDNTDSMLDVYGAAGQGLRFTTNDAERMRITSAGDVGIGTSSPASKLGIAWSTNTGINLSDGTVTGVIYNTGGNSMGLGTTTVHPMVFYTSNTERMRIDSSGNLLVGTTSGVAKIVTQCANGQTTIVTGNTSGTSAYNGALFYNNGLASLVGQISISGTTASYNSVSDYRLKENIAPMTGALETVAQLKPVTYNWKVDGSAGQGFIAHELQEVVPDCVTGEKDAVNEEGKPIYQGIDTSFLVATLTAAMQELNAKVAELEAKLEAKLK